MYNIRSEIVHCNLNYSKRNNDEIREIREYSQEFLQSILKYIIENNFAERLMGNKNEWENL